MVLDADVTFQEQGRDRSPDRWLDRLRDRAGVAARDGARLARDRTAIAASVGRAQVEHAQSFVAFHARRRPLTVVSLAVGAGLLLGAAVAMGRGRR
jgi:ElaB/YqjD/DUF883 family membrane-anchored ribosome-binding protein